MTLPIQAATVLMSMLFICRYAIALAANMEFRGSVDIDYHGEEVTKHLNRAIELDPLSPSSHFLKGKWCWGMLFLYFFSWDVVDAMYAFWSDLRS